MFNRATSQRAPNSRGWFSATHFLVWIVFGTLFFIREELDRAFKLFILLIPLLGVPALIAIATFFTGLIAALWRHRWPRLVSIIGAPTLVIGLLAASSHYQWDTDWVRFQLTHGYYAGLARALPGPSPKYHEWYWGDSGGPATQNIFYSLVYDETDKPLERPMNSNQADISFTARPYGNHFFLLSKYFQ